jgi:hypothetical protein
VGDCSTKVGEQYTSHQWQQEALRCLADAVKELVQAIYKPSNSNSKKKQKRNRAAWIDWIKPFGVLTDESIDISKISQQMTFYRVVHKGTIKTVFFTLTAYV